MVRCTGQGYSDTVVGDGQTSKDWSGWSGVQTRVDIQGWSGVQGYSDTGVGDGRTSKHGPVYRDTQTQGLVMGRHPRMVQCTGILRHRG